jgi:hypothetical protein
MKNCQINTLFYPLQQTLFCKSSTAEETARKLLKKCALCDLSEIYEYLKEKEMFNLENKKKILGVQMCFYF